MKICGLENMGNTCYANSILQLFMQCDSIIHFIEEIYKKSDSEILKNLNQFIQNYKREKAFAPVHVSHILHSQKLFLHEQQYDAHEFLIQFLDILDEEIKKDFQLSLSSKFLQYKFYTIFKNLMKEESKQMTNVETILTLPFSESLQHSFELFEEKEKIEDWESEKYKNLSSAEKHNSICFWPHYLFIQINRYDKHYQKINDEMEIPLQFNDYTLRGAVIHYGILQFGHYICIIHQDGKFFHVNDESVRSIHEKEAQSLINKSYLLLYSKMDTSESQE